MSLTAIPAALRRALPLVILSGAVFGLYVPSLNLPLVFDDAWSVSAVQHYTLADAFLRTGDFGYYRPLYWLGYMLAREMGACGPLALHVLCLLAHAANACLLYVFARACVVGQRLPVFMVALLYAAHPFAVQAVALPAGLNHVLAVMFALLAALCYVAWRRTGRRRWLATLLGFALCSVLGNEIGVVGGALAVAYELNREVRFWRWRGAQWGFLSWFGFGAVYAVAYFAIPKGESPPVSFALDDVLTRVGVALQMVVYPLTAPLALFAPYRSDAEALFGVAIAVVLLVGLGVIAWRSRWRGLWLSGVVIFSAGAAVLVARLTASYLVNAPRAFYLPLIGSAMMWSALALALGTYARERVVLPLAVTGALVALGVWHVRSQMEVYRMASAPVAQLARLAQVADGQQWIVLNLPEWVAPATHHFLPVKDGAIISAPYVSGAAFVRANAGVSREVSLWRLEEPHQELPYTYATTGAPLSLEALPDALQALNDVQLFRVAYSPDGPRGRWVGGVMPKPAASAPLAVFDAHLALHSAEIVPCQDGWMLTTRWQRLTPDADLPGTLSMFAQLYAPDGALLAQQDGALLDGLLPFHRLTPHQQVTDRRRLDAPIRTGEPHLLLGVYDYAAGRRLALSAMATYAQTTEDQALVLLPAAPNASSDSCR